MTKQKLYSIKYALPIMAVLLVAIMAGTFLLPRDVYSPALVAHASEMRPVYVEPTREPGENILHQGDRFDLRYFGSTITDRAGANSHWTLPALNDLTTPANAENVVLAQHINNYEDPRLPAEPMPAEIGGDNFRDAVRLQFRGYNNPGDSLLLNNFSDVIGTQRSRLFYFSMWVYASQDMYFDITIDGAHTIVYDLGRRFFVPQGQWTEIGILDDGYYPVFRTNTTDPRHTQYLYSSAARHNPDSEYALLRNLNDNDEIGNPFLRLERGWTALKITTHQRSIGPARPDSFPDDGGASFTSGYYFVTAPQMWAGPFVDKDDLNDLILEFWDLYDVSEQFVYGWDAYYDAIQDGIEVWDNLRATAEEVNPVVDRIALARARLVRIYPRDQLIARLAHAREFRREHFNSDWDWQVLLNAIETGDRVVEIRTLPRAAVVDSYELLVRAMGASDDPPPPPEEPPSGCGCGSSSVAIGLVLIIPLAIVALITKRKE